MPKDTKDFIEFLATFPEQIRQAFLFALIGVFVGTGQLLQSRETITARIWFGRAITVGGLSVSAGSVLVWIPDIPFLGLIGVSALMASIGTIGLEKLFDRVIQGRIGK